MKFWIFSFIACLTLVIKQGYSENPPSNEIWDTLNYRKKLDSGSWLPFKLAFPENYVVLPADRNKELGLEPGFFCGERSTIKDLWQQYEKNPDGAIKPLSGTFLVSWSRSVVQRKSNTFSTSNEEIREMLQKQGATSMNICDLYWNEFPVKAVEATLASGSHIFTAWVGLNANGETIKIRYFCPKDKALFKEESAIWNHFINNTTALSRDEYFRRIENIGFEELQQQSLKTAVP